MKSVTLVAFIGSWFCSSLTSRLRKSADVIVPVEEELDEDVEDVEDVAVDEVVEETVMANSGSAHSARCETHRKGAIVISFANQTDGAQNSGAKSSLGIH
jgi:hypothetical protein